MVLDKIENVQLYFGLSERIKTALKYISETNFSEIENGKYDVVEGEVFAIVNRYQTIDVKLEKPEAHKKHIDLQYVFEGEELLGYALKRNQDTFKKYNEEDDYELFNADLDLIKFDKGMFAILFPDDLHSPGIHIDTPKYVTKIVVKVLI